MRFGPNDRNIFGQPSLTLQINLMKKRKSAKKRKRKLILSPEKNERKSLLQLCQILVSSIESNEKDMRVFRPAVPKNIAILLKYPTFFL